MRTIAFRIFLSEFNSPCSRVLSHRLPSLRTLSTVPDSYDQNVRAYYSRGLAHLVVRLPSRNELCCFPLKPLTHRVGDLLRSMREEDHGIRELDLHATDGSRISSTDTIDTLFSRDFVIEINGCRHHIPAVEGGATSENVADVVEVRNLVSKMFAEIHAEGHHLAREKEMAARLHDLREQLVPMEKEKAELESRASRRIRRLTWLGLGAMGLQFGLLSRLTWWEYSWDIMEPVTYFIGQGYLIMMFAYYVLTRQEYTYTPFFNRIFLKNFYKGAAKRKFEVEKYNHLNDEIYFLERELKRLRDPLVKQLPLQQARLMTEERAVRGHSAQARHLS